MLGYASVSLLGTVAAAVEPCVSNAGNKFGCLLIEVKTRRKGTDGEYHENTELISTTVFGNGVSVAEKYLRPGDPVGLTCRLTGSASKASDGKVRHFTNVIVEQIHLIPCGRNGN
jgi:single-stranded DNA-binding protein